MKCSLGISNFFWRDLYSFPSCCFPLFICIDRWGTLSYLSSLFFGTLHSDVCIFPLLLCFSLLFFSQLFVRPPQTAVFLFCISFPWGWFWSLSPVQCHKSPSVVHQALYLSDRWEIDGETVETVAVFIFWAPKSLQMVTAAMKLKDAYSLEGKLWPT